MELDEGRFDDLTPEKVMSLEFLDDGKHYYSRGSAINASSKINLGEILEDAEKQDNEDVLEAETTRH